MPHSITSKRNGLKEAIIKAEKEALEKALSQCKYNISRTALHLGIDRKTVYNKIRKFGIEL